MSIMNRLERWLKFGETISKLLNDFDDTIRFKSKPTQALDPKPVYGVDITKSSRSAILQIINGNTEIINLQSSQKNSYSID